MRLQEYQAKALLAQAGLPVQEGVLVETAGQVTAALKKLGRGPWVLKAQIRAGGRGKHGGVKIVKTPREAAAFAGELLGRTLVTSQTGARGLPVKSVFVSRSVDVERELYAAVALDRVAGGFCFVASARGGMDVESAAEKPVRFPVDPWSGLDPFQARSAALTLGLEEPLMSEAARLFEALARAALQQEALLAEINPLGVVRGKGGKRRLLAMDAKMVLDDNAAFRRVGLPVGERDVEESPLERRARRAGLSFVDMDGDIGCLVNGAGLAMATMDLIKSSGGEPANFLDVGGGARLEQVTEACKLLLADRRVKVVLANIFGGIMECDVVARALVATARKTRTDKPLIVRMEGNRADEAKAVLAESGLALMAADDLADAAEKAVAAGRSS